jgi:hypothetical protein
MLDRSTGLIRSRTMQHDVEAFRARYRSAIHPAYRAWLHAGFVLGYGLLVIGLFLSSLERPGAADPVVYELG